MSRSKIVTLNSIILSSQQIIINLISIFIIGFIARELGKEDYGIFSLAFSFPIIFSAISNMGLRTITVREIAKLRNSDIEYSKYLSKIIPPRVFFILLGGVITIIVAIGLGYNNNILHIIVVATFTNIIELLSRIAFDVFQAFEKIGKIAFRDILVRLVTGLSSILILTLGYKLYAISFVYLSGALLGLIINVVLYQKYFIFVKPIFNFLFIKSTLRQSLPFVLIGFSSVLYTKIDLIMLSKMISVESVGSYNAAANLYYRLNFIGDAISTASFSAIAQLYWSTRSEANSVFFNSLKQILFLSIPMAIGGYLLSKEIIFFIFGNQYSLSVEIFKILAITFPLMFLNSLFNFTLGAIKKQNTALIIVLMLSLFNFTANFILIPIASEIGATLATAFTQLIGFIFLGIIIFRSFKTKINLKYFFQIIFPTIIMGIIIMYTKTFGLILSFLMGSSTYIGIYFVISGKKSTFKLLKSILKN